jgi:AraC-like DNA-binding protein
MLFEHTMPWAAGYFQCDLSTARPPRDRARHAGLLYIASGLGTWTVGNWKFPCRRGDLFCIPAGESAAADLSPTRPLGYYYCYFEVPVGVHGYNLAWPWMLGQETDYSNVVPCASGPFRPELAANFRAIQYELSRKCDDALVAARAHLTILGINFARMLELKGRGETAGSPTPSLLPLGKGLPESVACVVDYVQEHLANDLCVSQLASIARCSERRLVDVFRNAVGTSPMDYVRERRIFEAQKLLVQGLAIKDVANRLNFADSHHFSRVFRQKTGISPSEYAAGKAPLRQKFVGEFETAAAR